MDNVFLLICENIFNVEILLKAKKVFIQTEKNKFEGQNLS